MSFTSPTLPGTPLQEEGLDFRLALRDAKERMERHFRDVCEFEFTVEDGKVYLLAICRARCHGIANVRIALSFFAEGKITLDEAISRISARDIGIVACPVIDNESELQHLGYGLAASSGVATGHIALTRATAEALAVANLPYIFLRDEVCPDDIPLMWASDAVVTCRGGKTSHAAVVCRGMGKPAVTGVGDWTVDAQECRVLLPDGLVLVERDWLTINGNTGAVFAGRGEFSTHWMEQLELKILNRMYSVAILHDLIPANSEGIFWRIRDFMAHGIPLNDGPSRKRPVPRARKPLPVEVDEKTVASIRSLLRPVRLEQKDNLTNIVWGLIRTLSRLLSRAIGIGNHHRYCRVLWDPMRYATNVDEDSRLQLVGVEYFDVNRYIKELPDIAHVLIAVEVEIHEDGCFLEYTNPAGPSLVARDFPVNLLHVRFNGHAVADSELPKIYNVLRKREYRFNWYSENGIDHADLVRHLQHALSGQEVPESLTRLANDIGLMEGATVSAVGESLVGQFQWSIDHAP